MRKILPLLAVGILVLSGLGAGAYNVAKKSTEIVEVKGGIGHITIVIENTGEFNFDELKWSISVQGGVLGNIDVKESGYIEMFDIKTTEISKTDKFIFGLGKIDITIDADYADTWIGTAFVFGPFIMNIEKM